MEQEIKVDFGGDYYTNQIYSKGFEFAFMFNKEGVFRQVCPFVYCKDFLHDAIWSLLNQEAVSIFSFKYSPEKNLPIHLDKTVLAFRNTEFKDKQEDFHRQLPAAIEFLQGVDRIMGFRPTQIHLVEHPNSPCWLIIADEGWQLAPPLISLFTLMVRIAFYHTPGDNPPDTLEKAKGGKMQIGDNRNYAGNRDCSYVAKATKGIEAIFKHGLEIFHADIKDNYPAKLRKNGLHDRFGIVSFSEGTPEKMMPHWYKEEFWK